MVASPRARPPMLHPTKPTLRATALATAPNEERLRTGGFAPGVLPGTCAPSRDTPVDICLTASHTSCASPGAARMAARGTAKSDPTPRVCAVSHGRACRCMCASRRTGPRPLMANACRQSCDGKSCLQSPRCRAPSSQRVRGWFPTVRRSPNRCHYAVSPVRFEYTPGGRARYTHRSCRRRTT